MSHQRIAAAAHQETSWRPLCVLQDPGLHLQAKANLQGYAEDCQQSPVSVTIGGEPRFELVPIYTDDPGFIERLLEDNKFFRRLAEEGRREADEGRVSTLTDVRKRLNS